VAVVEVGLGGRLDATNVLPRPLAVVTDVDRDHQERLGRTLAAIAREKAGIIRRGSEVVSGCRRRGTLGVIRATAKKRRAHLTELDGGTRCEILERGPRGSRLRLLTPERDYGDIRLPLLGAHQVRNAALAVLAVERWAQRHGTLTAAAVRAAVRRGLPRVRWPGRLDLLDRRPVTLLDVAHNPHGAVAVEIALREAYPARRATLVFGCLAGKDCGRMLRAFAVSMRDVVLVSAFGSRRTAPIESMQRVCGRLGIVPEIAASVEEAVRRGRRLAGSEGLVLVTGSSYLVAEAMALRGRGVEERI